MASPKPTPDPPRDPSAAPASPAPRARPPGISPALASPEPAFSDALLSLVAVDEPGSPPLPPSARSPPERTAALAARASARAAGRDADAAGLIAAAGAVAEDEGFGVSRARSDGGNPPSSSSDAAGALFRRLDAWADQVTRHSRDAERARLAAAAASETKKTLEAQWSSFQAEGRVPSDPFLRELAAAAAAREEEAAALRAAVAATAARAAAAEKAEAEKSATLAELHEKARLVAAKDAEARAAEAEAAALEADLPPTAAVVAAADAGLDLKSLSLRIARDLDASVDRVARAARGERFVEPEPHRVPEALPSHPYPIVATPVAPVLPPLTQTETAAPAMTRAQTEQFEEQLRASRRLAERRERELGREARPREPPAYAFSEGDDAFGSGEAPTHAYAPVPARRQSKKSPPRERDVGRGAEPPPPPPPPAPPPPPFAPPPAPPPPFAFGAPRRVLTGNTPRAYVSDLVEQAYAESLAQQRAVFGPRE